MQISDLSIGRVSPQVQLSPEHWVRPFISFMTLGELLRLSESQFPRVQNEESNSYLKGLNEIMYVICSKLCLARI